MKIIGDWVGVTYFEQIHKFLPDSPIKLCLESIDAHGNVKGKVIETFYYRHKMTRRRAIRKNTFLVKGTFDKKRGILHLREVLLSKGEEAILKEGNYEIFAKMDEANEKLTGKFYNRCWRECIQVLELSKYK